jgi:DNA-directed RNA polymerase specialized sigma24 family protein
MPATAAILPPKVLAELYIWLIRRAEVRGMPREIAEELANDTLLVACERYRPERGKLRPFCARVLLNKIINYQRSTLPLTKEFDEAQSPDSDDPLKILLGKEKTIRDKQFISVLLSMLEAKERRFLVIYLDTLEELERRAVSETARRLGLPEGEGASIMKRIARTAIKLKEARSGEASRWVGCASSVAELFGSELRLESNRLAEPGRFYNREALTHEVTLGEIASLESDLNSLSLERFWANLSTTQKERLASFG